MQTNGGMEMVSHLTTLIKRVRSVPGKLKSEPVFFNKLINLAEYMRHEEDFTEFEERKAKSLLKIYHLDFLLNIKTEAKFEREIRKLEVYREKGYSRTCIRCGRSLTNPTSIKRGYGPECYGKRRIVDDGKSSGHTKLTKFFDRLGEE